MAKIKLTIICFLSVCTIAGAQQPKYTPKQFVSYDDPAKFVRVVPEKNGFMRTFLLIPTEVWDVDDNNTTYVKGGRKALVCMEGNMKNGKREGVYSAYLIDSLEHTKRYKIWEQTYAN